MNRTVSWDMDDDRLIYDVPSTVHMAEDSVADTPRSSNRKLMKLMKSAPGSSGGASEADAYENPTELFQWINYGNYQSAAVHTLEHPVEARTWIVSRKRGKKGEQIKWRYLPIHLVCMKPNPSEDLLRALIYTFPAGARERDNDGNLPIHYLLTAGCDHREMIQMLLKAYPESIDKRDRKGRNLLELVSEGYRSGKLSKEIMVNMLAILRQWTINEDRSVSGNASFTQRQRGEEVEFRDAPPAERSSVVFEEKNRHSSRGKRSQSRSKRSVSRGSRRPERAEVETVKLPQYEKKDRKAASRDGLEMRLEDTLTERDVLRKTVAKLKSETKTQEMALIALNKQVEDSAHEQQKGKDKLKKKKDRIDELHDEIKEKESRFSNHQQILHEKEQKLIGKDKQLRELSEQIVKLVEQNDMLKGNSSNQEGENILITTNLEKLREENEEFKTRISQLLQSRAEAATEKAALQQRNKELADNIHSLQENEVDISSHRKDSLANEKRLKARIEALERELRERPRTSSDTDYSRGPDVSVVIKERDALKDMNASLQEHVGALKERCRHLEEDGSEKGKMEEKLNKVSSELLQARMKQTEYHEQLEQVKSESLIHESRLQTQVARLEKDLIEAQDEKDAANRSLASTSSDDEKSLDERRSLQMMNASLQEHVLALKDKCGVLEVSLEGARDKNAALSEELRLERFDDIGGRQKELHSEFQNLYSMVQGMANPSVRGDATKDLVKLQSENEVLRIEASGLKARIESSQSEVAKLNRELHGFRAAFGSMKATTAEAGSALKDTALSQEKLLMAEREKERLRIQLETTKAESVEKIKDLEVQVRELGNRADSYKEQLTMLKDKFETVKSSNSNLRDIIAKNNETFMAKVDSLHKELDDLHQVNESLHAHVHDMSVENDKLRNMVAATGNRGNKADQQGQIEDLMVRLNHVAGYLIAVSFMLQEENASLMQKADYGSETESRFAGKNSDSAARDELRGQVMRRQEALLASDDRDDIVQRANHFGHELRSGVHLPERDLAMQREELSNISATIKNLS